MNKFKIEQWRALPEELRPSSYNLKTITLQETEHLFKLADKMGVLNQFANLFWDTMSLVSSNKPSLQECLNLLEEQKRRLGRRYDKIPSKALDGQAKKHYIALKYNDIEYEIRWLVDTFELDRTSKPYLLEVNMSQKDT